MNVKPDVVIMSSKGQVVVPKKIRDAVNAGSGAEFVVFGSEDTIVFKKVETPKFSAKELGRLVAENERKLKAAGYVDASSVNDLVSKALEAIRR